MRQVFLVLGYGIPKNILQDENYGLYLKSVFNQIFAWCAEHDAWNPVIIFSGGKTDMIRPYRRTEAEEMIRLFRVLMRRPSVKKHLAHWFLIPEMKALSTLDNFLYAKKILHKYHFGIKRVIVFGEQTRRHRITALAKRIFKRSQMMSIDFDQSENRYLDEKFLQQKESHGLKMDRWALKSQKNLKKHRELFKQKLKVFRQAGSKHHVQAIRLWWEKELQQFPL